MKETLSKNWLTTKEAAMIVGVHPVTLRKYCAARMIDPECGRMMLGEWRFKRTVIEERGIVLRNQ
jgi:hypothetical protein